LRFTSFSRSVSTAKINTIFVNRAPLSAAHGITENLADVGDCEFDALLLKWIWKQSKRPLLQSAFAKVRISGLEVIRLFILLGKGGRADHAEE
jgi:hypothetical protein